MLKYTLSTQILLSRLDGECNDSLLTDLRLELFGTTTVQLEGGGIKILNIDNLYRQDTALRRLDYLALIVCWSHCNVNQLDRGVLRRPQSSFKK